MGAAEREYDEVVVLWDYLYTHYQDRLTETERKAGRVLIFGRRCPFRSAGGDPARDAEIRFEFGTTNPSVVGAMAEGERRFMERAAGARARAERARGGGIVVNRCPVTRGDRADPGCKTVPVVPPRLALTGAARARARPVSAADRPPVIPLHRTYNRRASDPRHRIAR